jgi:hypothetical protein
MSLPPIGSNLSTAKFRQYVLQVMEQIASNSGGSGGSVVVTNTPQVNIQATDGTPVYASPNNALRVGLNDAGGNAVYTDGNGSLQTHDTKSNSGILWGNNSPGYSGFTPSAGGYYALSAAAGTNTTVIYDASTNNNAPGQLFSFQITNTSAATKYLYWFDSNGSPSFNSQILKFAIPTLQSIVFTPVAPIYMTNGITFCFSTSPSNFTGVIANDLHLNVLWSTNNNQ